MFHDWSIINIREIKSYLIYGNMFATLGKFTGVAYKKDLVQSNFGRSNSPVSNTRDRSNSFVGPGNFPIHLMLKYTPGSNSDGSNSKHGPQGDFHVKSL